jgi:urease accessory protein
VCWLQSDPPMTLPARFRRLFFILAALAPSVVFAHPGHDGGHGDGLTWDFVGGFGHPIGGLDHLLAMVSVGLWAAQLGGRARWAVPGAFLAALAAGAALGAGGMTFGWVEQGIAASVLVLGLLVVSAARLPLAAGMVIAAGFAVFHGLAHGAEMPASASGAAYGAGFLAATALLHAAGLGLGLLAERAPKWVRQAAGAGLVVAGGWMLAA